MDPIDAQPQTRSPGLRRLVLAFATVGGVGYLPGAPGTVAAALAVVIFVLFSPIGAPLLALTWVALVCLGAWAAEGAEAALGREDDGRIVIDEVAGQLLALVPLLAAGPLRLDAAGTAWLVTGFVLFRGFDIAKPGPVRWADRRLHGGIGVMMDDLLAGALAAAVLGVLLLAARAVGIPVPAAGSGA